MSTSRDTARGNGQQSAGSPRREKTRLIRAGVIVLLLAAGCYMAYGIGKLWAEWRHVSQPVDVRQAAAAELASPAMVLPLDGHWSFAELDWKLHSSIINKNEVAARFELLAATTVQQVGPPLPDVSPEIIKLVESLQLQPVERDGNRIYRLDRRGLQAQLVARMVEGRPKAVSLAAACPQHGEKWQLFELTPRRAGGGSTTTQPFLLPLPSGAVREGGRFANDGRPLLELITVNSTADTLCSTWKAAGWEVRTMGLGGADEFRYLCTRGEEVIYAWSADEPGTMHNLMLVRTPNNTDTDP